MICKLINIRTILQKSNKSLLKPCYLSKWNISSYNRRLHENSFHISVNCPQYIHAYHPESELVAITDMMVYENFISEEEEKTLLEEVDPYMRKLHYEFDHWDNAIHGYRETERLQWNDINKKIIQRVRDLAYPPQVKQLSFVHILDLAKDGYIKPHVDSVRFCGNIIAGMSLLSSCVMRLTHEKCKDKILDVLLDRRSLYIMKDIIRYDYAHEIFEDSQSFFKGKHVPRDRRLSIICRNEPETNEDSDL